MLTLSFEEIRPNRFIQIGDDFNSMKVWFYNPTQQDERFSRYSRSKFRLNTTLVTFSTHSSKLMGLITLGGKYINFKIYEILRGFAGQTVWCEDVMLPVRTCVIFQSKSIVFLFSFVFVRVVLFFVYLFICCIDQWFLTRWESRHPLTLLVPGAESAPRPLKP